MRKQIPPVMFKDSQLREEFKKSGYVKLSFMDDSTIENILNLYHKTKHLAGVDKKFYTSIWSDNVEYKKLVDSGLKQILIPALNNKLQNYKTVFANFMVKLSGEGTQLPPHQDWSFVDEPEFESITLWIPLKDVDKSNGALEICPKSHLIDNFKRARFLNSPFKNDLEFIEKNLMQSISMKKGEALFVNPRTIHSSPPNLSEKDRIAVTIVVVPDEAQIVHYVLDKENESVAHKLIVDQDFFIQYSCFDYPNINNSVKEILISRQQPTIEDLISVTSS